MPKAVAAKVGQAFRVMPTLHQLGTLTVEVGALPYIGGRLNMRFTKASVLQLGTELVEIGRLLVTKGRSFALG